MDLKYLLKSLYFSPWYQAIITCCKSWFLGNIDCPSLFETMHMSLHNISIPWLVSVGYKDNSREVLFCIDLRVLIFLLLNFFFNIFIYQQIALLTSIAVCPYCVHRRSAGPRWCSTPWSGGDFLHTMIGFLHLILKMRVLGSRHFYRSEVKWQTRWTNSDKWRMTYHFIHGPLNNHRIFFQISFF